MPQPLLEGHQEYVQDRGPDVIEQLTRRIDALENRIDELEADRPTIKRDAVVIVLSLLTESLRHVASGKMDIPDVSHAAMAAPQFDPRWDAWKQKLGAGQAPARIIDALLTHGPLNRTQLRQE